MLKEAGVGGSSGQSRGPGRSGARVGVAALERGLGLLSVLNSREGLSLSEAARRAGLNKTTAFRLMKTLERTSFVSRGEDDKYRLGQRFATIAGGVKRQRGNA